MGEEQRKQSVLTDQHTCLNDFPESSANLEASLFASFYSFHNLYVPHETDPSVGSRGLHSNRLRWRLSVVRARAFGWTVNSLMVMLFSCTWTSCHQSIFLLLKKKKKKSWGCSEPFSWLEDKGASQFLSLPTPSMNQWIHHSVEDLFQGKSLTYRFHFCKLERDAFYLKRFKGGLLRGALFHKCMPGCGVWWWLMILITPACDYQWRASVSPGFHLGMDLLKAGGGHSNLLQYACLENPIAWWATVRREAMSWAWLSHWACTHARPPLRS